MNVEDDISYHTETAQVHAELVRLDFSQDFVHFRSTLLWAFRCRAVQMHLYIHACTPLCWLKNRSCC